MLPNPSDSRRTEWNRTRKCSPNPKRSRGNGSRRCGSRHDQGRSCTPVQYDPEDRRQMGRSLPRRRRGWLARSILRDLFHRQASSRLPQPTRSKACAVSAETRSTSRPRSASPKPASHAFSNAAASAAILALSRRSYARAMSARSQVRSSISTSRRARPLQQRRSPRHRTPHRLLQ